MPVPEMASVRDDQIVAEPWHGFGANPARR